MPIIGTVWFSFGTFLLFNSVLNYLPDAYPEYAASVLAGNDFMRSSFGAGFPLFAAAMYNRLGVDWASSLLAFLSIAFIPIPFVLYRVSLSCMEESLRWVWLMWWTVWRDVEADEQACEKGLLRSTILVTTWLSRELSFEASRG